MQTVYPIIGSLALVLAFCGMVGLILPKLIRLKKRSHALLIVALAFPTAIACMVQTTTNQQTPEPITQTAEATKPSTATPPITTKPTTTHQPVDTTDTVTQKTYAIDSQDTDGITSLLQTVIGSDQTTVTHFKPEGDTVHVQINTTHQDRAQIADNAIRWLIAAGNDSGTPAKVIGLSDFDYQVIIGSGADYTACVKHSFGTTVKC